MAEPSSSEDSVSSVGTTESFSENGGEIKVTGQPQGEQETVRDVEAGTTKKKDSMDGLLMVISIFLVIILCSLFIHSSTRKIPHAEIREAEKEPAAITLTEPQAEGQSLISKPTFMDERYSALTAYYSQMSADHKILLGIVLICLVMLLVLVHVSRARAAQAKRDLAFMGQIAAHKQNYQTLADAYYVLQKQKNSLQQAEKRRKALELESLEQAKRPKKEMGEWWVRTEVLVLAAVLSVLCAPGKQLHNLYLMLSGGLEPRMSRNSKRLTYLSYYGLLAVSLASLYVTMNYLEGWPNGWLSVFARLPCVLFVLLHVALGVFWARPLVSGMWYLLAFGVYLTCALNYAGTLDSGQQRLVLLGLIYGGFLVGNGCLLHKSGKLIPRLCKKTILLILLLFALTGGMVWAGLAVPWLCVMLTSGAYWLLLDLFGVPC